MSTMSETTTEDATEAGTATEMGEVSTEDLRSVLEELGLTPGQIKGRLDASKKNEARWKAAQSETRELSEKARLYDELQEQNKSETEKLLARAEAAEKKALETELSALRASVALEKGLTPSQAKRLVGASREDLEADADELLADLKNTTRTAPSAEGQGKTGEVVGQTKQITSRDQLKSMSREEKLAAYRDGRLSALTG